MTAKRRKRLREVDEYTSESPTKKFFSQKEATSSKHVSTPHSTSQEERSKTNCKSPIVITLDDSSDEASPSKEKESSTKNTVIQKTNNDHGDYYNWMDSDDDSWMIAAAEAIQQEQNPSILNIKPNHLGVMKNMSSAYPVSNNESICAQNVVKSSTSSRQMVERLSVEMKHLIMTSSDGNPIFRFYWLDAQLSEDKPGLIHLFGKYSHNSQFYSCCVNVINIPRIMYLLPKPEANVDDVLREWKQVARAKGINEFTWKRTRKFNVFASDVPREAEYIEIRCSAVHAGFAYRGRSIKRIFSPTVSSLETLLTERSMKGPCWLDVLNPMSDSNDTWCSIQVRCTDMQNITITQATLSTPPLLTATLNVLATKDQRSGANLIAMIIVLFREENYGENNGEEQRSLFQENHCFLTKSCRISWPGEDAVDQIISNISCTKVIKYPNEWELLTNLVEIIKNRDPDIYVGFNCKSQFELIMSRFQFLRKREWSKLGKLKRDGLLPCKATPFFLTCGRPIVDIKLAVEEFDMKFRSDDIWSLAEEVLNVTRESYVEVTPETCDLFYRSPENIARIVNFKVKETIYISQVVMHLNVIFYMLQLASIIGNTLSKTLADSSAQRTESLLLRAFSMHGYIVHRERAVVEQEGDRTHEGGLILSPKVGYYRNIVISMDYISLYPSIIEEYNLCFSTVNNAAYATFDSLELPAADSDPGVIPLVINSLKTQREEIQKLMEPPNISNRLKLQYDARQKILKKIAITIYGSLAWQSSRFHSVGLAAMITAKGREILLQTKNIIESLDYNVIYGDTDSVMFEVKGTGYREALAIGNEIKELINQNYKHISIRIDKICRCVLLYKKKMYAAVTMNELPNGDVHLTPIYKGLEIVRRDRSKFTANVGKMILDKIFFNESTDILFKEIYKILVNVSMSLKEDEVPLQTLVIRKRLSKNPLSYNNENIPEHVNVARRINSKNKDLLKAGDIVPYIMCQNNNDMFPYHPDEFSNESSLKVSIKHYLENEIFPMTCKICTVFPQMDVDVIRLFLGIDECCKPRAVKFGENEVVLKSNYEDCVPFVFKCTNSSCNAKIVISRVFSGSLNDKHLSLSKCSNTECTLPPWKYATVVKEELRGFMEAMVASNEEPRACPDPICGKDSTLISCGSSGVTILCKKCATLPASSKKYPTVLNTARQREFFQRIFDITPYFLEPVIDDCPTELVSMYHSLRAITDEYCTSKCQSVDLGTVANDLIEYDQR